MVTADGAVEEDLTTHHEEVDMVVVAEAAVVTVMVVDSRGRLMTTMVVDQTKKCSMAEGINQPEKLVTNYDN